MKFQQLTAPVTAKGVEDTALYRFHRLVSLNEVGSDPDIFGISVRAFHADAKYRQRHWPHEMLTTSTHDTKRSEDTRARIDVLSEMPALWRQMLARWRRMNRLRKREIEGRPAPGPNQEYLLYQILLGSWPLEKMGAAALRVYTERIAAYMIKAAREAKSRTSWSDRSRDYEDALTKFVQTLLEMRDGNLFLHDIKSVQGRIARFGALNSLSQTLCKLTAPGVPDIYQGNEMLDFSLVDPDNRRAVDYGLRSRLSRRSGRRIRHSRARSLRTLTTVARNSMSPGKPCSSENCTPSSSGTATMSSRAQAAKARRTCAPMPGAWGRRRCS